MFKGTVSKSSLKRDGNDDFSLYISVIVNAHLFYAFVSEKDRHCLYANVFLKEER
jgi:hypothetical protein